MAEGSNFLYGRPHGADSRFPHPPASTWAWPLTCGRCLRQKVKLQ